MAEDQPGAGELHVGVPCEAFTVVTEDGPIYDIAASALGTVVARATQDSPFSQLGLLQDDRVVELPRLDDSVGHTPSFLDEENLVFTQNQADGAGFVMRRWNVRTGSGDVVHDTDSDALSQPTGDGDEAVVVMATGSVGSGTVVRVVLGEASSTLFPLADGEALVDASGDGRYLIAINGDSTATAVLDSTGRELARLDGWRPLLWLRTRDLLLVAAGETLGVVSSDALGEPAILGIPVPGRTLVAAACVCS